MFKCIICNKKMKVVTNTHLRIVHSITPKEYKEKYSVELVSKGIKKIIKKKLSGVNNPNFGKKITEEHKMKISKANKGRLAGDKNPSKRLEVRVKISKAKMGHPVPQHVRDIASKTHKGKKISPLHKLGLKVRMINNNPMNNPKLRLKVRKALLKSFLEGKRTHEGENNPRWMGGISLEPYGKEFNSKLKVKIRNRDENECKACFASKCKLNVHHIDYNKTNNNEDNLILLCNPCHMKIGKNNREEYKLKYSSMIGGDVNDTQRYNFTP